MKIIALEFDQIQLLDTCLHHLRVMGAYEVSENYLVVRDLQRLSDIIIALKEETSEELFEEEILDWDSFQESQDLINVLERHRDHHLRVAVVVYYNDETGAFDHAVEGLHFEEENSSLRADIYADLEVLASEQGEEEVLKEKKARQTADC